VNKKLLTQLVAIFIATQLIGLFVGIELVKEKSAGEIQPGIITKDTEDPINSIALIAYILVFTGVLLILIKYLKKWIGYIFKILELIVIFSTSIIVFSVFFLIFAPQTSALVPFALSILLVVSRIAFRKSIWLKNVSSIIAVAGVGALIGVTLGIIPVILFLVALSVYDLIAVFYTKHMVVLAKAIVPQNLSFTYAFPTKEHTFELGTGDMVIPLTFAVSVLDLTSKQLVYPASLGAPILVLTGSLVGLILTLEYSSKHIGKALPALPPQTIIMILMLGISALLGFIRF